MLKIDDSLDVKLETIDVMRRAMEKTGLWVVTGRDCPIPTASPAEIANHRQAMDALLHYARIGVLAAHGKL